MGLAFAWPSRDETARCWPGGVEATKKHVPDHPPPTPTPHHPHTSSHLTSEAASEAPTESRAFRLQRGARGIRSGADEGPAWLAYICPAPSCVWLTG